MESEICSPVGKERKGARTRQFPCPKEKGIDFPRNAGNKITDIEEVR